MKLSDLITDDAGKVLEPAYFWSAAAILVGFGLEVYCSITGKPFDFQAYGIGACALLGGLGLSAKFGK
ncbi:hypothetical protein [Paraburkholderia phosphatilytica]|uniref:hypothetical protein n=1 Tax=Paraburkholderia phosphatilytica TaxID=2282883 RepID=UPI000E53B74C|nr:hypothetical protein [Paraburkholderia phosphatilytica]